MEVGLGGQCTPCGRPHNLTTGLCSSSTTMVSPEPFLQKKTDKVTAVPVRRNGNFQTPISVPVVSPKQCHTLSNPARRQDYTVACLNYTLQTMMPLPGWPVMAPNAYDNNNLFVLNSLSLTSCMLMYFNVFPWQHFLCLGITTVLSQDVETHQRECKESRHQSVY